METWTQCNLPVSHTSHTILQKSYGHLILNLLPSSLASFAPQIWSRSTLFYPRPSLLFQRSSGSLSPRKPVYTHSPHPPRSLASLPTFLTPPPPLTTPETAASAFCLIHVCSHTLNCAILFTGTVFNTIRCNVPFYNKCYVLFPLLSWNKINR